MSSFSVPLSFADTREKVSIAVTYTGYFLKGQQEVEFSSDLLCPGLLVGDSTAHWGTLEVRSSTFAWAVHHGKLEFVLGGYKSMASFDLLDLENPRAFDVRVSARQGFDVKVTFDAPAPKGGQLVIVLRGEAIRDIL